MRIPLVIKQDYIIEVEYFEDVYWIHMDVIKWSASIRRKIIKDLSAIKDLVKMPLRCLAKAENLKLQRFSKILGCNFEMQVTLHDGGKGLIFKWG